MKTCFELEALALVDDIWRTTYMNINKVNQY